ncbi:Uncharacterised protein [Mycobacteroides abscessus subsp. abscessus]|uniref:hypothetical protein n=1 Tax=Mycobacteroides abscessus TaxID=36809 RepID=UPI0009A8FD72|nr:hypothetical protein [Mycobacteroides abscessus]QSM04983.1 hypothetical protein PROPHIGD12-2_53 [Mycobacterium phage prophiGD12-2]MBN7355510.1 hypothetical protein [Mycobacteroides abscessus subsp. abscessus]MBN7360289.1 hypothetical protein [Mycobacteroides abscessus subsp. abscessus]MBN7476898.1 hypothetical protein [Mycobacteroides abscessus subsp. abscessus]SLI66339.1 Uncharacterised protein [Mycobacteroides abscessus subsp. abscessus]
MPSIRSDLVGVIYLPGGARLSAGDPVPPGEVVGVHLIEDGDLDAADPEPTGVPTDTTDVTAEEVTEAQPEPAEGAAEAPEPVAPRPATSRTRKRSSGRAR